MTKFTIDDAQVVKGGHLGAHVIYTIGSVSRRYREFEWLRSALLSEAPGIIVPTLPGKSSTGNLNPAFVSERRAALEAFLNKIAGHESLAETKCFHAFLESVDLDYSRKFLAGRINSDASVGDGDVSAAGGGSSEGAGGSSVDGEDNNADAPPPVPADSATAALKGDAAKDVVAEKPKPKKKSAWGFSALAAAASSAASSAASAVSSVSKSSTSTAVSASASAASEPPTPADQKMEEIVVKAKALETHIAQALQALDFEAVLAQEHHLLHSLQKQQSASVVTLHTTL